MYLRTTDHIIDYISANHIKLYPICQPVIGNPFSSELTLQELVQ